MIRKMVMGSSKIGLHFMLYERMELGTIDLNSKILNAFPGIASSALTSFVVTALIKLEMDAHGSRPVN